jgi:hypothetical protein
VACFTPDKPCNGEAGGYCEAEDSDDDYSKELDRFESRATREMQEEAKRRFSVGLGALRSFDGRDNHRWTAGFDTGQTAEDGRSATITVRHDESPAIADLMKGVAFEDIGRPRQVSPTAPSSANARLPDTGLSVALTAGGARADSMSRRLVRGGQWYSAAQQRWYDVGRFFGNQYTERAAAVQAQARQYVRIAGTASLLGIAQTGFNAMRAYSEDDWGRLGAVMVGGALGMGAGVAGVAGVAGAPVLLGAAIGYAIVDGLIGWDTIMRSNYRFIRRRLPRRRRRRWSGT